MKIIQIITISILSGIIASVPAFSQSAETSPVSLQEALELAAEEEKKILIDVYAEWCPYCQSMHSEVYKDDEVLDAISAHFIWVKINVESDDPVRFQGHEMTEAEFAQALENQSVPTTYFMNDEGAILGLQPGYIEADMFSMLLRFVGSDAFLTQTFQEYQER